jgi:2-oxo-4-hydroxy-4-carboxy-5-ureidoimidazoline decarboxylase
MLVAAMDLDEDNSAKNAVLTRWNGLDAEPAAREVLPCCGSQGWAEALTARRPFASAAELLVESDAVWARLGADDWQEAFDSHPRIGQTHARAATAESLAWSSEEQLALAEGNRSYEEKFGRIFIVCALGKSSAEILALLNTRMSHDAAAEMLEAAEQQRQITQIRLRRWLGAN